MDTVCKRYRLLKSDIIRKTVRCSTIDRITTAAFCSVFKRLTDVASDNEGNTEAHLVKNILDRKYRNDNAAMVDKFENMEYVQ